MNYDDKPMWDDPAESSRLRQLLRAGRDAAGSYNVERGVVRHLANLQAGVPLPEWASSLPSAKTATAPLLAWLAVPFLAATAVVGVWLVQRTADAPTAVVTGRPASVLAVETSGNAGVAIAAVETRSEQPPTAAALTAARGRTNRAERSDARVASVSSSNSSTKASARATASRQAPSLAVATPRNASHVPSSDARNPTPGTTGMPSYAANATSAPVATATASAASEAVERAGVTVAPVAEPERVIEPEPTQPNAPARAAQRKAADEPAPVTDDSRLEREMQMLAVAQRVLADDPGRALQLARQGEHEFAGSMFSAERKQVALLALVRLGRLDEARRLGRPFLAAYPNAPWSERLRRALASGQLPKP